MEELLWNRASLHWQCQPEAEEPQMVCLGEDRRPRILQACRALASKALLDLCWVSLFQPD